MTEHAGLGELRALLVDDSAADSALIERFLKRAGYALTAKTVGTLPDVEQELLRGDWDVVICDYSLGDFDARAVLAMARLLDVDVPIVIVSGTIGEDTAAEVMIAGARDFITKSNLARLPAAIRRERLEASDRRQARTARRLHELVINSVPIILFAINADGMVTLSEGCGLQAIGRKNGEMVGSHIEDLYGDAAAVKLQIEMIARGEKSEIDLPIGNSIFHVMSVPNIDSEGKVDGLAGVAIDVTARHKQDEQLRLTVAELRVAVAERRELVRHLVTAQEQERERIAADLHDDTIQVIAAVGLRIGALGRKLAGTKEGGLLDALELEVSTALKRSRNMLFELHPRSLDIDGLGAALEEYIHKLSGDEGPDTTLTNRLDVEPQPETRKILFRIAQEAITNARKHGRATTVGVSLSNVRDGVLVRVEDDGIGFEPTGRRQEPGHLGLSTMNERARLGHGWLRIESAPNEGTVVEFWLPSPEDDRAA